MAAADLKSSPLGFLYDNAVMASLQDTYASFSRRRDELGLTNPGNVENIAKEVQKDVLLTNGMFTGFRADLTKVFNLSPIFRVSHALSMGSQGNMPPYAFSTMYGSPSVFMQGNVGTDGNVTAWANYRWTDALVSKVNCSLAPGQGMMQLDNDYTGKDFTASIKSLNPSILDGSLTGIFIGSYLQSVTPSLALGVEAIWQRQAAGSRPETAVSYCGRYAGSDWVASAQLQAQGAVNTSFWKKLSERVEAGVDMNLAFAPAMGGMMGGIRKEGTTAIGIKYDFRASSFRAQVDSAGKLSCLLEKRIAPPVSLTFAGEIDQVKQTSKIGLAVSIEAATEEIMEQNERAELGDTRPPPF